MLLQFPNSGFLKEVTYIMITLTIYILDGIGRCYVVFLFEQLKQPNSQIQLDGEQRSWIAGAYGFLSPIGCLLSGTLVDFLGRKRYICIMYIPFIISWAIIAFAKNYEMLFCGMIAQGLGIGMTFCASAYISEIALARNRGAYLGLVQIWYSLGIVICNISMCNMTWNTAATTFCIFAIVCTLLATLLTESPIWLYSKGRREESIKTLCSFRCSNADSIINEIKDLEKAQDDLIKTSICEMSKNVFKAWKPLLICLLIKTLLQNSGYVTMRVYTVTIFEEFHLPIDSSKFTIEFSIAGFLGSVASAFFMFMLNRKTLLFLSTCIMGICMVTIGIYEEIFHLRSDKLFPYIVPLAFYINALACNFGADPITFCLGDELFPNEARGILNGIYGAFDNFYMSVTFKFFPTFLNAFGIRFVIWTFSFFMFAVAICAIFILPETKGKTLNEVQEEYFKKKRIPKEIKDEP